MPAPTTFEDWQLVFLFPWGTVGVILAVGAAAVALVLSLWSLRGQRGLGPRLLLAALRALAIGAVLLIVLQPAVQLRNVTLIPNHVALLLDLSHSMSIRQQQDGPSRLDQARRLLERSRERLAHWRKTRVVDQYGFGSQLRGLEQPVSGLEADDPVTHLHAALTRVAQDYRGRDLAAVVLISDGIANGRFAAARTARGGALTASQKQFLRGLETPIHTVWIGHGPLRDVAVAEVFSDAFAFVRNAVQVDADITVHGIEQDRVEVTLERGGQVVARRVVQRQPGKTRYRVRFEFVPSRVGSYVYAVRTPVQPGEALTHNNSRSFVLKVIRDRIRVLQVCGRPSWDERFLRQLLKRDPNVDLISFFILRTPTDLSLVPTTELSLIPFPTEELFEKELGSFDLVVLQDFNFRPYGIGVYLPHLKRFVEQGGGLAMVGGSLSFSAGGYHGTPVGEILPVVLPPDSGDVSHLLSEESFRLRVTRRGLRHPVMQLGRTAQETARAIEELPSLAGANLLAGPTAGASVLAVHPRLKDRRQRPMPIIATRNVGKGRTLAVATDSTWHWAFHAVGQGRTRQAYDRFWRNAIRWLIRDPELRYLRIIAQRDAYRLGAPVRATVRAYNPDYSPAEGVEVVYTVGRLGDEELQERKGVTDSDGELPLEIRPRQEGVYRIRASAQIGGRKNQEQALLLVDPAGPEDREPMATPALLREISKATGGQFVGQADELPDLELRPPRTERVNWHRDVELWSTWWSLLAAVLLLGLEWLVRRRFGYL